MMLNLIVLTTLFLAVSAPWPDMPPQEARAKLAYARAKLVSQVIDDQPPMFKPARHVPEKHQSKYCHDKAIEKLDEMCPNKCNRESKWLKIDLCQEGMTDLQILKRCCPDRIGLY